MRQRSRLAVPAFAVLALAGSLALLERDASACGGCFSPPGENPTVVTDHRMILTIAQGQSTLYDQIQYTGSPSSFAWVLPISGSVDVGLSSNIVFQAMDGITQTQIVAPPLNCPSAPTCGTFNSTAPASDSAGGSSGSSGGVTVTKEETVGPYETVQLKATDPAALETWLSTNGFNVPQDVQPVVDQYVNEKFDFLAIKLIPGKSVQDMRPVRVTTKGANAVLPLRMVAAGTGATVGISLWIVAEGRYEPMNFPTFHIDTNDISWDWTTSKSDYTQIRATKESALGGKGWELESSAAFTQSNLTQAVTNGYYYSPTGGGGGGYVGGADPDGQANYLPVTDGQGNVTKSASQVRDEDLTTLFYGIPESGTRVTRVRSDIAHAALNADLVVTAGADQTELSPTRQLTRESNEPQCPIYNGCDRVGTAPRSEAIAHNNANGGSESFGCSTAPSTKAFRSATSPGGLGTLGIGAGFLALSFIKSRRRKA